MGSWSIMKTFGTAPACFLKTGIRMQQTKSQSTRPLSLHHRLPVGSKTCPPTGENLWIALTRKYPRTVKSRSGSSSGTYMRRCRAKHCRRQDGAFGAEAAQPGTRGDGHGNTRANCRDGSEVICGKDSAASRRPCVVASAGTRLALCTVIDGRRVRKVMMRDHDRSTERRYHLARQSSLLTADNNCRQASVGVTRWSDNWINRLVTIAIPARWVLADVAQACEDANHGQIQRK